MSEKQSLASTTINCSTHGGLPGRAESARAGPAAAERRYWKPYFADDNLAGNEVQVLQKEGQKLASTLSKAFPNDARATWTIESLQDAVAKTQQTWEAKERLGKGRPQALFHGLMQKFDTHSHLFEVIPQGDLYTSLITGGAMIVVKASVNHSKTIEELSNAMDAIGEAIGRCSIDSRLIRSRLVQDAVAKLYIEVFKFLGEAAVWYNSSSTRKVLNSLHRDFSERFRGMVNAIKEQADQVQQAAQLGSQAEVRVARLQIEELYADFGRAHVSLSNDLAALVTSLRQRDEKSLKQHDATRDMLQQFLPRLTHHSSPGGLLFDDSKDNLITLAIEGRASEDSSLATPLQASSVTVGQLRVHVNTILERALKRPLDEIVSPGRTLFRPQLLQPINQWLTAASTPLMYIEYQSSTEAPDTVVAAAQCVTKALRSKGFFCVTQTFFDTSGCLQGNILLHWSLDLINGVLGLLDDCHKMNSPAWKRLISARELSDLSPADLSSILGEACRSTPAGAHVVLALGRSSLGEFDVAVYQEFWRCLREAVDTNGLRVLFLTQSRIESFIKILKAEEIKVLLAPARSQAALVPVIVPGLRES